MRLQIHSLLAAVAVILTSSSLASATDILTPAGLNPGDSFRFIFVTSGTRNATSTNISDYNTFVQNDATGYTYGGQPITWNAIGSTSTVDARDNVGGYNTNVPVYLVTGTKVATDLTMAGNGLWAHGNGLAPVNKTIAGITIPQEAVWTGTTDWGVVFPSKGLGAANVQAGDSSSTVLMFSAASPANSQLYRLYGLSGTLTVASVPEPSTYAMAAIATGVITAIARRRKAGSA